MSRTPLRTFTADAAERIGRVVKGAERRPVDGSRRATGHRNPTLPVMHLVTDEDGIDARVGDVMGIADCYVRDITSDDGTTLSTTTRKMPVRNPASTPVGGNKFIVAAWDTHGLICLWEECPT